MIKHWVVILAVFAISMGSLFVAGCDSSAKTDALIGAAAGAAIGQAAGRDTKSTLIGAAVGGGAGYIVGSEQDKKKAQSEANK